MANIVFITTHDLGRFLNCYDRTTINSPHLDALARTGVLFQNSFCTAPQCSPSRSGLHTGRYPHANAMLGLAHPPFGWELGPGEKHITRRLQENGYATALVGEQHLSASGRNLGYDTIVPLGPARQMGEAAAQILSELATGDKPFYLEVGFHEPHRPYDWGNVTPDDSKGVAVPGFLPDCLESRQDFAALQGSVAAMDAGVGVLLEVLQQSGLDRSTWLIFTTDHGVAMPRAKGTLYDPGIETALLMRWPDQGIEGGGVYGEMISNVDIVPTLLEGANLPVPSEIQGRSFWPLLQNQPYQPRAEVFAEKTFHQYYEPMRGIRTTSHKLIVNMEASTTIDVPSDARSSPVYPRLIEAFGGNRAQVEFYDLKLDPWEENNLTTQPLSPELLAIEQDLRRRLLVWMEQTGDPILRGPISSPYYHEVVEWLHQPDI